MRWALFLALLSISAWSHSDGVWHELAPDLKIQTGDNQVQVPDYQGKVILLDFWASWCGPCRQSFPWMNSLMSRYKDQGLEVIAVNLDQEQEAADDFLKEFPASFRVAFDPDGELAEQMNVSGMPMSYVIDRSGRIRERLVGFSAERAAHHEQVIADLIKE